ncbi:MAG: tetratricopeptide repeat protein [Armatimonadetes bacterium]|nr:tetratricopeptide repeat protein [Armatimonadota bacterium]
MQSYIGSQWVAMVAVSGLAVGAFAAGAPGGRPPEASGYAGAMAAGKQKCAWRSVSGHERAVIHFAAARADFREALALAQTDGEKAAAHLAIAGSQLDDYRETDYAAIRQEYARVLALAGAAPREKAQALLGMGETFLREKEYDRAREQFGQAGRIFADGDWPAQVQFALGRSYLQERRCGEARRELARLLEMEGVIPGRGLGWEARALLQAIDLLPLVRADHPRLFFNTDTWPAVKERALTVEKALLDGMRTRVDRTSAEEIVTGNWGMAAMEAAFVYRITGDAAVLEKVRRMLRATADYYLQRTESRANSDPRIGWLAALDWVWNSLPPAERENLASDMLNYLHSMYVEDRAQGNLNRIPHYYKREVYWYGGLGLLGAQMDNYDWLRAFTVMAAGYGHSRDAIEERLATAMDDGAWQVNLGYSVAALPNSHTWNFMYTWQSALGREIPRGWANIGVHPDYALRQIVDMGRPQHRVFPVTWADHRIHHFGYSRTQSMIRADLLYDHLAQFIHFFGESHPEEAAVANHLRRRIGEEVGTSSGQYPVFRFLMTNLEKAPPPALPPGLPLARHFEGVGQVLMSSGFGPEETCALFIIGGGRSSRVYTTTSNQLDATHFTLYKKGFLALDSGAQNDPVHDANYYYQTVAHNAVLIRMPGETFSEAGIGQVVSNSGGQNRRHNHARALAFETNRLYAYAATDATETYHEDKCARMVRQLLYLAPDHFVVFDRVAAKKAEYPKTWLLHTANEPLVAGREFRADQGAGRIFCRTLYPLDGVLEKIGGPGREFWADGRDWPLPEDYRYWTYIGMEKGGEVPEHLGRWRVEVKPAAAREEDYFLHLIQVSDRGVEKMVESRVSDKGNQIELAFTANGRGYTIGLNKTGEVGGQIRISEAGNVLVDRPLAQEIMPQAGLAPGE